MSEPATSENAAPAEWLPEVQCPAENAPINAETVRALRLYIRKLEVQLLVAPQKHMIRDRDELMLFHIHMSSEKEKEAARLKLEIEDLTKLLQEAALTGTVKLSTPVDPTQLFTIPKDEWKNKIITTLGFSEKEFYMQFSAEKRLVRLLTDADVKKAVQDEVINPPQMPPV